jgi:type IV pilus assembly protein PilP
MMNPKILFLSFLIAIQAIAFVGCSDETAQPAPERKPASKKPVVDSQKASKTVDQASSVSETPPAKYVFDPIGKRDPFENPLRDVQIAVEAEEVPLTPLQKFDLGQLRLIGVIIGKGEPTAMVLAPGGQSFILKKGVKVGRNMGTVASVTADGVQIEERYVDFSGEVRTGIQELQLPKRGGVN